MTTKDEITAFFESALSHIDLETELYHWAKDIVEDDRKYGGFNFEPIDTPSNPSTAIVLWRKP